MSDTEELKPVWEIEVSLGDYRYTVLTTEEQRDYEWNDIRPVGYLVMTKGDDDE